MCMMKKLLLVFLMILGLWMTPQVSAQSLDEGNLQHELLSYDLNAGEERFVKAPFVFQAFALDQIEAVQVKYRQGSQWTDWQSLAAEEARVSGSELVFIESADAFSLRSETDTKVQVTLMHFNRSDLQVASINPIGLGSSSTVPFRIQSRSEWGADEGLRTFVPDEEDNDDNPSATNACEPIESAHPGQYQLQNKVNYFDNSGRNLIWPQRYSRQVKKIVIHHTALSLRDLNDDGRVNSRDYRLAVQAIYTYHTVSNGWGDVGYHYLVDPDGNVYEGRAGGKDVIGAHVLCQNSNTVGIAVMGNYEEEQLSRKAFEGLVNIVQYASEEYGVNPEGKSSFRGTVLPHIVTHAEVGAVTKSFIGRGATQCPGEFLKKQMMELREIVADGGFRPKVGYSVLEKPRRILLDPLEKYEVPIRLKNTGETAWNSIQIRPKRGNGPVFEDSTLSVASGQEIEIKLPFEALFAAGSTTFDFQVRVNDQLMKSTISLNTVTQRPQYRYRLVSIESGNESLLIGENRSASITLKNTSNFPWLNDGPYQVQMREIVNRGSEVMVPARGLTLFLSEPVPIDGEVTLSFEVPVQRQEGKYQLQLAPVLGRNTGFKGPQLSLKYSVESPHFAADIRQLDRRNRVQRGFTEETEFVIVNEGNFDWEANSVWFAVQGDLVGKAEKIFLKEALAVGDSRTLIVPIRAGYDDRELLVKGNIGLERMPEWLQSYRLRESTVNFEYLVRTQGRVQLNAEYVSQSVKTLENAEGTYEVWVDLKNTGSVPWYRDGEDRMVLEVQNTADFRHRSWEEKRTYAAFLEKEMIMPGEVGRFLMTLQLNREVRRTTYDDFLPVVNGKRVKFQKGRIRFGVETSLPARPERSSMTNEEGPSSKVQGPNGEVEASSSRGQIRMPKGEEMTNDQITMSNNEKQIPPMRVLLTEINQDDVRVTASGDFRTWVSSTEKTKEYSSGDEVKVLASQLDDGTVIRMRAIDDAYFRFTNWDRIRTFGAGINDNTFRGVLEFRWDADEARMIVINELPLDQYMKGVAEVPETADQPQEKRKVIAVLARSYALHYLISGYEKFPGKPYNAADSPAIFQKYVGQNFEGRSPKWQRALEETSGEVVLVAMINVQIPMTKNERVLRAAYFSCTDGPRTKSWDEVWSSNEYFQRFGDVFQSVSDPLGDDPGREGFVACGHQVGLSGYGATQKAAQGATYDEIIQDYYQGVEVGVFNE